MSRFMKWVMLIAATVFISSVSTLAFLIYTGRTVKPVSPLTADANVAAFSVPEFDLIDQAGDPQTRQLFLGKVTVLDFIFTNCPFACPTLSRGMWEMQQSLAGTPVRFASITVDPDRDTPARLREYADGISADLNRWTFLTGKIETIRNICTTNLGFNLAEDTATPINLPDGTQMHNISHPTRYILIGPDARVIAIFGSDELGLAACKERARAAAAALPAK